MLKIFYIAPENTGVAYYRFYQPLEDLRERGLIELDSYGFDFTGKNFEIPSVKKINEIGQWADVVIFGRLDHPGYFNLIQTIKEVHKKKVILDIDDNIFAISPYVAAAQAYNVNGPTLKLHQEIARYMDGIIVSTEFLKNIYEKYNKVWIVENGIKYAYNRTRHDSVNIGFMCSGSHLENAQIIEGAVIEVLRKYPQTKFYYTKSFSGFMERVPEDIHKQINYVPFFPLNNYLKYVNNLNLDIGLAPLMENDFNKAKSNIRVLEYWQNQTAVIASPLPEYLKTVDHGFNGYVSNNDEWVNWISDLVVNTDRRNYLIQNATRSLKNWDISKFADKYLMILRELTGGEDAR